MMHASRCYSVSSIEEGICMGLGGTRCYSTDLSRLEPRDVAWAWDEFTAPNVFRQDSLRMTVNVPAGRKINCGRMIESVMYTVNNNL